MKITQQYLQARKDAIAWLKSKQNFSEGLQILSNSGYKPLLAAKIAKWGETAHATEKLVYEIRTMIQAWGDPESDKHLDIDPESGAGVPTGIADADALKMTLEAEEIAQAESDENQLPPVIRKIIYQFSADYKARSVLHAQLSEMGEDNSAATCTTRKTICQSIDALSLRMNWLYDMRKQFEADGTLPNETDLARTFALPQTEAAITDEGDDKEENKELPEDLESLKKLRKSEATKLIRARNMLLYQQEAKPKPPVENPMGDGPKRIKYERKIANLEKLVETIDYKIAELS